MQCVLTKNNNLTQRCSWNSLPPAPSAAGGPVRNISTALQSPASDGQYGHDTTIQYRGTLMGIVLLLAEGLLMDNMKITLQLLFRKM